MVETNNGVQSADTFCTEAAVSKVLTKNVMRPYLEKHLLPDLRQGIKELLHEIINNGALDKHWAKQEKENQQVVKQARRAERDRKRLAMGSAYNSDNESYISDSHEDQKPSESSSEYDSELDSLA